MKSRLLAITLAVVLAVVGIVAVLAYVRQANVRAVNGLKAEKVVYALGAIPADTSLTTAQSDGLLSTEMVPDSSVTNPLQSVTTANGKEVVTSAVPKGQVLLQNMLSASATAVPSQSIVIPSGDVAVTIQLCASEASADYLTAGSQVMVFATYPTGTNIPVQRTCEVGHTGIPPNDGNTQIVLPSVKVLAVTEAQSQSTSSGSSSTSADSASAVVDPVSAALSLTTVAVTFAVTPGQAQQLIEASQVELPYLALLPTG